MKTPATVEEATACLQMADVPPDIVDVVNRLQQGGHAAVLVGGAVRDALRGISAGDWDVATSATPEQVEKLFRRTIPTGVAHGTVTVLVGRGERRRSIEVTTFRGEGVYVDGRHPSEVMFLPHLEGDLERRDFTVNAFAWDPVAQVFIDRFAGLDDLARGVVRAVGDPLARFREDGLRTMRAVRFCATLEFSLDPATSDAIVGALDVLDRVSRERVRAELVRLLAAQRPSLGLGPLARTGMWKHVLPSVPEHVLEPTLKAVDAMRPDAIVRLARLLWPLRNARERILTSIDDLRVSKDERATIAALVNPVWEALVYENDPAKLRAVIARGGVLRIEDVMDMLGLVPDKRASIRAACEGAPMELRALAISGRDLISTGIVEPGPRMGELLAILHAWALDDPRRNTREALLDEAQRRLART